MKKVLSLALALALVLALAVCPVSAATKTVKISLAPFQVVLNGQTMDTEYSQYPPIFYNDITYFPLTYNDCRFMGVTTDWNNDTRTFKVDATGVNEPYKPYTTTKKNAKNDSAVVPEYTIVVNGKVLDNTKEQYPFLNFRGVTYFPMTWDFCHTQFGWNYSFTSEAGFDLSSSSTPVVKPTPTPVDPTPATGGITVTHTTAQTDLDNWSNLDHIVSMSKLPTSVADLKSFDITNEYISAAAIFATLARFETDFDGAMEMLDYLMGPEEPNSYTASFIRNQINQYPYVMRSYFEGATPKNDYTPTSYTLIFRENSYSRQSTNTGYTTCQLYCPTSGADNPRPVTLRLKPSTGEWFLFSDTYKGPMVGVVKPASLDPWN